MKTGLTRIIKRAVIKAVVTNSDLRFGFDILNIEVLIDLSLKIEINQPFEHFFENGKKFSIGVSEALTKQGIRLHFSELKGFVMAVLGQTAVIDSLTGKVFLSTRNAVKALG